MARYLLTALFSILVVAPAQAQTRRAVMENLATTNSALFISSTSSVYVQAGGSFTVRGTGAGITRLSVGTLTLSTTVQLEVAGLVRVSSGIVTAGGQARGANSNDLQLVRSAQTMVTSGAKATTLGGEDNTASGDFSVIVGGYNNSATGTKVFIGGGESNTAGSSSTGGAIAGGASNSVNDSSDPSKPSFIGGGNNNSSTNGSVVGGGNTNTASFTSVVGGGATNTASASQSTVGGGLTNTASGDWSTVAGGSNNTAKGNYSTVPGGYANNASGLYSLAAGRRAKASAQGSFALADATDADYHNNSTDTFKSRFATGYVFEGGASTMTAIVVTGSASPAATDACSQGKIVWDASYIYVCTATAVWKRAALTGGY